MCSGGDGEMGTGNGQSPGAGGSDGRAEGDRQRDRSDWPVRVFTMGEEPPDWEYWLGRTPGQRSAGIESLRAQHHGWTDGALPRLPRVLRVVQSA